MTIPDVTNKEEACRMLCAMMMCNQAKMPDRLVGAFLPVIDRIAELMLRPVEESVNREELFRELMITALESDELKQEMIRELSRLKRNEGAD